MCTYTRQKKKFRYQSFCFYVVFLQKRIKIRKLETELIENFIFLPFSNSLLIICGIKASFKVDVHKFNNRFVFYMLSLPQCSSLILTLRVAEVTPVMIGIRQKWVRQFNDLALLFSRDLMSLGAQVPGRLKSSEFNVNVSPGIIFTFCKSGLATSDRAMLGFYFSLAV